MRLSLPLGISVNPVDDKIVKEVIKDLRGVQPQIPLRWEFALYPTLVGFLGLAVLASMALFMPKEIPPRRTEIFSAKNPALPPATETAKKRGDAPPVKVALKAEPKPSIPAVQATGSDKSVSEIVPPAPVQWQTPGNTQAPAAAKTPVPNDGGAPAKGGAAGGPKLQSHRYMVRLGSFVDKEEAEEIKARLKGNGYKAVVKTRKHLVLGKVFVIQLQPVGSSSRATKLMTQLRGQFEIEPSLVKVPSR
jgi:cell division septation protein DedD